MNRLRRYCCVLFSFVFLCTSISIGFPQVGKGPPVISLIGLDLTDSSQIGFFFSSHNIDKTYAKEYPLKYFFTTLLVPNDELWVNLSPRLSDMEIVGRGINNTDLGRLLLYYDVKLKEDVQRILGLYVDDINAFLMRQDGCGLRFWIEVGVVRMEVDGKKARIKSAPLEVKVEVKGKARRGLERWLREKVVPILRDWVNRGEDYALLRQAFNSMILAQWYKKQVRSGMAFFRYIDSKAKGKGIVSNVVWFKSAYLERYVKMYFGGYSGEGIWSSLVLGGIKGKVKEFEKKKGKIPRDPGARVFDGNEIAKQIKKELDRFEKMEEVDQSTGKEIIKKFLHVWNSQNQKKQGKAESKTKAQERTSPSGKGKGSIGKVPSEGQKKGKQGEGERKGEKTQVQKGKRKKQGGKRQEVKAEKERKQEKEEQKGEKQQAQKAKKSKQEEKAREVKAGKKGKQEKGKEKGRKSQAEKGKKGKQKGKTQKARAGKNKKQKKQRRKKQTEQAQKGRGGEQKRKTQEKKTRKRKKEVEESEKEKQGEKAQEKSAQGKEREEKEKQRKGKKQKGKDKEKGQRGKVRKRKQEEGTQKKEEKGKTKGGSKENPKDLMGSSGVSGGSEKTVPRQIRFEEGIEIELKEGEKLVVMNLLVYFDTMKRRIEEFCERLRQGKNIKLAFYISDSFLEKCREQQEPPRSLYFALSLYTKMPDRVVLLKKEERGGVKEKWEEDLALVWNSLPTLALIGKDVALIDGGVGELEGVGKKDGGEKAVGKLRAYREVKNDGYVLIYSDKGEVKTEQWEFGGEEISEVEEKGSKIISTKKGNVRFVGKALDEITSALNGEREEPIYIRVNKDNEGGIRVSLLDAKKGAQVSSDSLALEITQNGISPAFLYGENGAVKEVLSSINRDKWSMVSVLKEAIKKEMQVRYYGEKEEIASKKMEGVNEVRLRGVREENLKEELEAIFNNKEEGKRDFYIWICPRKSWYLLNGVFPYRKSKYILRFQPHYPIIYGEEEKDWALLKVDHNSRQIRVVNVGSLDENEVWDIVSRIKKAFMPSVKKQEFELKRMKEEKGPHYFVGKEFYLEKGMGVVVGEGGENKKKQWEIIGATNGVYLCKQGSEEKRWIGRGGKVFIDGEGNFCEEFSPDAKLLIEVGRDGFVSILGVKKGVNFSLGVEKKNDNQQVYVRDIVYKDKYLSSYKEFKEKVFDNKKFSVMVMDCIDGQMQTGATSEYLVVDWDRDIALRSFYEKVVEKVIERLKKKLESEEKDKNIKLEGLNKDLENLSDALIRVDRARVEEIMNRLVRGDVKAEIIRYVYDAIKKTVKYGEQGLEKGTIYFIGDTINKRGVCRHTALLTGAVLERLSRAGFLLGRNYLIRVPRHVFNVYVTSAGIPVVLDMGGRKGESATPIFAQVTPESDEETPYSFSTDSPISSNNKICWIRYTEVLKLAGFRIPEPIELNIDNGISTSWLSDLNRNQIGNKMAFVSFSSDLDEKGDKSGYILRVRDLSSGKIVQVGADQVDKDKVREALDQLNQSNSLLAKLILENWDWISQRLQFYVINDNEDIKVMLRDFFGWGGRGKVIVSSALLNRLDDSVKGLLYLHEILEALVDMGLARIEINGNRIYLTVGDRIQQFPVNEEGLRRILFEKLLLGKGSLTHYLIYELERSDVESESERLTLAIRKEKKDRGDIGGAERLQYKGRMEGIERNMPDVIKTLLWERFVSGQWQEGAVLHVLRYLYGKGNLPLELEEVRDWNDLRGVIADKVCSEMGKKVKEQFLTDWHSLEKETDPTGKRFKRLSLLYKYKVYELLPDVYGKAVKEAAEEFEGLVNVADKEKKEDKIVDAIDLLSWYDRVDKREKGLKDLEESKKGGLVLSLESLRII